MIYLQHFILINVQRLRSRQKSLLSPPIAKGNQKIAIKAGVDILVSGTTVFKENGGNLKKNIQLLKTG